MKRFALFGLVAALTLAGVAISQPPKRTQEEMNALVAKWATEVPKGESLVLKAARAPDDPVKPPAKNVRSRGHKAPSPQVQAARHEAAFLRHDGRVLHLRLTIKTVPDVYESPWVDQTQDQGQCGSCWDVSATGVITCGYIKAGVFTADGSPKNVISPQYVLDCGDNGGCDGDDAPTVLEMARTKGLPTSGDYGPYTASPGRCLYTNQKLYKIADWGFCTPNQQQGIASTDDIKRCLMQYGVLSTAVAANSDWDNYVSGIMTGDSNSVNHDVAITGWKMQGTTTVWHVHNQWGKDWGEGGYCWIPEGRYQIGTEGAWISTGILPPPPVPPVPPVPPIPPTPPVPTPGTLVLPASITLNPDGTWAQTTTTGLATSMTITYADGTTQTITFPPVGRPMPKAQTKPVPPTVPPKEEGARVWPKPTTYDQARSQAVERNLPLVVWAGNSL